MTYNKYPELDLVWVAYTIVFIHMCQFFWIMPFNPYKPLEKSSYHYSPHER